MEKFVDRICDAVKKDDALEVKRIIHQLITIGACDQEYAITILRGVKTDERL